jgi:hypothetical protein
LKSPFRQISRLPALLAAVLLPAFAQGGLKWDSTLEREEVATGQSVVTAEFRFQNAGDQDVVIESLRTNCDCTRATASKMQFSSGEAGAVLVIFSSANRRGYERKVIEVRERGVKTPTLLTLAVHFSDLVKVSPEALEWKEGDTSTKAITISAQPGVKLEKVAEARGFTCEIHESPAGTWKVFVTPQRPGGDALLRVPFSGKTLGTISIPLHSE